MTETALIVFEKLNTDILFTEEGELDKVLKMIKSKVDAFEPDLETKSGRKEIASFSRKVSSSKAFLDKLRKAQNAKAQAEISGRNSLWKPAEKKLETWRDDVRQPLTDYEVEQERLEKNRIAGIKERIQCFSEMLHDLNGTATQEQLEAVIAKLEGFEFTPDIYFEFTTEAQERCDEVLIKARFELQTRIRLDKEEAERKAESERLEKVAKEQDEAAAKIKEQQDAIDEANRKIEEEKRTVREGALKNIGVYRAGIAGESLVCDEPSFKYDGRSTLWNDVVALADDDFDIFVVDIHEQLDHHKNEIKQEQAEFERKAKIQAEADAKAAAEQAEKNRIAAEKLRKEEEIRQQMLKPDKEKLIGFSQFLAEGITYPKVESSQADFIVTSAWNAINDLAASILKDAQNL